MADKSVGELIAAQSVTPTDLFVLEQNGTAKKLTGQILENWLVSFADGHGGIQSIVKKSTSGLVDTYRITLADTTTFDFMVTNGKGINSVSKVSTSGLVDTYRITFNDGTSSTFTVTNGEKGDKGDRADIWVKYASKKPTASSHSFGDVPDSWIGIATGHNMDTAPTDWQQYTWFQWKGEKGDTGDPATLISAEIRYRVGDSGTIMPSGSWSESVPPVTPGKFLWTRQVLQFNTGTPITSYSISRFGIDGTGSVSTVAGISPDATGNVHLTAADVKALPIRGGTMEGAINMNGHKITGLNLPEEPDEPANKDYVDKAKQKYGKLVVFGDSIGEGANNDNYSYVDMLGESGVFENVVKACYGGAGIGSYDATNGYNLNSQIERYASDVRNADIIILEYGVNDATYVLNGTATMGTRSDNANTATVCGYTQKAINRIRELNAAAVIHWVNVLPKEWQKLYTGSYPLAGSDYADVYTLFLATAMKKVMDNDIYIIDISNVFATTAWMSNDNLHPNTAGQKVIANTIMHGLFNSRDVFPTERPITLTITDMNYSTAKVNGKYAHLRKLIEAGVSARIIYPMEYNGTETRLEYYFSACNDYQIGFYSAAFDGNNTTAPLYTEVRILYNDTVEIVNAYI